MRTWEPSSHSLDLYGTPDRIRSWRKDVYHQIGGHRGLSICDDHELMIRTYMVLRYIMLKPLYI